MPLLSFYEVAVIEGLEPFTVDEIRHRFGHEVQFLTGPRDRPGMLQFTYGGKAVNLLNLKTVLSLFLVLRFPVPRPKALLGHQNMQLLLEQIRTVIRHSPSGTYRSLYLAAAGSDSAVMQRLAQDTAAALGLQVNNHEGDLLLRVRRPKGGGEGWEVLIRMAPRPLSVRPWRVCDLPGALNAAAAHVMIMLTRPQREDRFLNLACGSGTLLAERSSAGQVTLAFGCDIDRQALSCARANLAAARAKIKVYPWDAARLPLQDGSMNVLCSDLPFGHDVGSHDENLILYPHILREAARVCAPGGRAVFLSHELRLMSSILERSVEWALKAETPLTLNGLHPHIYSLVRLPD